MTFDRISTGIKQLDDILGGGFPKNSINIVMGHPGTGKTVLAEQLVFHNADGDRPILYLTTISEPLSKVITYLQGFSFYDEAKLFGSVVYNDLGSDVLARGPDQLVEYVRSAIRDIGPKIIVIDSFKAVGDLADSQASTRRMISELAAVLSAYDTTVFLIGEYSEDQIPVLPEFAVADGIIELSRQGTAKRDERLLRVFKLRGSAYAEGLHAFRITRQGLHVFPRLVTPSIPKVYAVKTEQISTGVPGLDELLAGGLVRGSTALVTGQAGTGKTTLALQFAIAGIEAGTRSLYVNFQENPTQLARGIKSLGGDFDELTRRGLLFQYESPVELRIDSITVGMFNTIREQKVDRVVIDALGDLALASGDRERFHDYLYSVCQHMIVNGVTTLMTMESDLERNIVVAVQEARFSSMSDAIIDLQLQMRGTPTRTIRVVKARGLAHDLRVHEMVIESGGIRVKDALK